MMKKIVYTLIVAATLMVGCKKSSTDLTPKDPNGTPIMLKVGGLGVEVGNETSDMSPATRATTGPGTIMVTVADFGATNLALYGVSDNVGTQEWTAAKRIINVLDATVLPTGMMLFTKNGDKIYFPENGNLSVYSLYPSPSAAGSPIQINDDGMNPVTATITLPDSFDKQYDILQAKAEAITAVHAQSIQMPFDHLLSQLRFKIYRDADVTGRLTKITVHGINKAELSIKDKVLTPSADPLDQIDYVAYSGAPIEIATTVAPVGVNPILLIPGVGSINKVVITVDGQDYPTDIPADWDLAQGKINTVTLHLRKFGVKIDGQWTVSPWGKGQDHTGDLENSGKVIAVSSRMLDAQKSTNLTMFPTFADVEIDGGYTHKGIAVTSTNGIFTTERFNTGIIHDEPMSLTALKLYTGQTYASAKVVFDGKLAGGLTSGNKRAKIIIDTLNNGRLKIQNGDKIEDYDLNMVFGGFGAGTENVPYEVANATTLANVAKFPGSTSSTSFDGKATSGAFFVQVANVDLKSVPFTPITFNSGIYNGNGYTISNLSITSSNTDVGLFGAVNSPSFFITTIQSVVIESGSITFTGSSSNGVGSIAGTLERGRIIGCVNKASVTATTGQQIGGIVGRIRTPGVQVSSCANYGKVIGRVCVGGIVGEALVSSEIFDCYNRGEVSESTAGAPSSIGGIVGKITVGSTRANVFRYCYNTGAVNGTTNAAYTGAVIGFVTGAYEAPNEFKNIYYLDGTFANAIGTDQSSSSSATLRVTKKSQAELQDLSMITLLNDGRLESAMVWRADKNPQVNSGYPIFLWQ